MTAPYYADELVTIYHGDSREVLPALGSLDTTAVITGAQDVLDFGGAA